MNPLFHFDANGKKQGPYNKLQLRELAVQGIVSPSTRLETDEGRNLFAGQIPDLFNGLSADNHRRQSILREKENTLSSVKTPPPSQPPVFTSTVKATESVEVGKIYEGLVTEIKDFGAFIEILPGCTGLCHISELAEEYVENINDHAKVGDSFSVKVISIDDQNRIKLSRKTLLRDREYAVGSETANPSKIEVQERLASQLTNLVSRKYESPFPNVWEAAKNGTVADVRHFIEEKRVDVNVKNTEENYAGQTPLFGAVCNRNIEIMKYLISQGADVNVTAEANLTPLFVCVGASNYEGLKYLVSQGANVNAETDFGAPLRWAVMLAYNDDKDRIRSVIEIVKYLIYQGADVNAEDKNGNAAYDMCHVEEIKDVLKKAGATKWIDRHPVKHG